MAETNVVAIVDWEDSDKVVDVVESTSNPWTYWVVILNADGSDI